MLQKILELFCNNFIRFTKFVGDPKIFPMIAYDFSCLGEEFLLAQIFFSHIL